MFQLWVSNMICGITLERKQLCTSEIGKVAWIIKLWYWLFVSLRVSAVGEKAKKYRGTRRPERGPGYLFVSRRLNPPAGLHIAISQNEWTRVYFGKLLFCWQRTLHWSVWVWDEVLRPGFLCPVVKLARQKRDNQVKTLSSIVFATLMYALKNIWKTIKKKKKTLWKKCRACWLNEILVGYLRKRSQVSENLKQSF